VSLSLFQVEEVRAQFPICNTLVNGHPLIYMDSAATTQKPKRVVEAMSRFYLHEYATVHRAIYGLSMEATARYDAARSTVKEFIHAAHEDEIIFTRGTTDSINLVRFSFGGKYIHQGDEVIVSALEHHSNLVPWQMLCQEKGAKLRIIPVNDEGEIILEEYQKLLNERTKLVSIAHVYNTVGTINPVKEIIALAHEWGAKVLIDGAQAAARIPIDVQDLDADFYAFSGHKAYGPTGVGILYGKRDLLKEMPPVQGGGDMVDIVSLQHSTYKEAPLKFEAGTPMIAEVLGLQEAIFFIEEVGIEEMQDYEEQLLRHATGELEKIPGLRIYGTSKQKSAIIGFTVEGIHALDLGTLLDFRGIAIRTGSHCAHPAMERFGIDAMARISFGIYNTEEEIAALISALTEIIFRLRK